MPKQQSLTFISKNGLIKNSFNEKQRKELWNKSGFDKTKMNYSWDNEDYRQSQVNPDIQHAIPKEEDFLPFPFRHLSATIVGGGGWKATEFPEKVLKKSVNLLSYKPNYVNHNLETGNVVGVNGKMKWTPAFVAEDGTKVPGGIDGPIWVDGKLHPDICRKLASFPVPHIQSVSVTVIFEWEASHTFENRDGNEDEWLFEMRIGQMVDGEMVRRIATKIIDYYETSLVWLGADPFAKVLMENGDPLNVDTSAIVGMSKFEKDPLVELYKEQGRYFISETCISNDKKLDLVNQMFNKTSNSGKPTLKTSNSKNTNNNNFTNPKGLEMEKVIQFIAQQLGKTVEEITEDFIKGYSFLPSRELTSLTALKTKVGDATKYDALVADNTQVKADLKAANDTGARNKPLVDFATAKLEKGKENALKFYRLSLKDDEKENEATVKLIERAVEENDFASLDSMTKQYGGNAVDELGATCLDCDSKNISFRTTSETDDKDKGNGEFIVPDLANMHRE